MSHLAQIISLQELGDERGNLVVMEGNEHIPFNVKRVYYIYATKQGVARGFHAHRSLKQLIVAVHGSCEMHIDNGSEKEVILLDEPTKSIVIGSLLWHEMHKFSEDCVLLCLASEEYDECDYIRNYDQFMRTLENETE